MQLTYLIFILIKIAQKRKAIKGLCQQYCISKNFDHAQRPIYLRSFTYLGDYFRCSLTLSPNQVSKMLRKFSCLGNECSLENSLIQELFYNQEIWCFNVFGQVTSQLFNHNACIRFIFSDLHILLSHLVKQIILNKIFKQNYQHCWLLKFACLNSTCKMLIKYKFLQQIDIPRYRIMATIKGSHNSNLINKIQQLAVFKVNAPGAGAFSSGAGAGASEICLAPGYRRRNLTYLCIVLSKNFPIAQKRFPKTNELQAVWVLFKLPHCGRQESNST
eukprot:TRINITY_DN4997_c0_g2_i2.p2 TRINITY_DN4997_c0_g2~~TRINITY_DN4997_c0_g2_i2.p2  ORF type:complete len:274 (-),score=-15.67 TRINITY_DN4997_c0_g2_i2:369-1190(-)